MPDTPPPTFKRPPTVAPESTPTDHVAQLHEKGGRTFTTSGRWIARLDGHQAVAETEEAAAEKLLNQI